jgi:hypothetical protein
MQAQRIQTRRSAQKDGKPQIPTGKRADAPHKARRAAGSLRQQSNHRRCCGWQPPSACAQKLLDLLLSKPAFMLQLRTPCCPRQLVCCPLQILPQAQPQALNQPAQTAAQHRQHCHCRPQASTAPPQHTAVQRHPLPHPKLPPTVTHLAPISPTASHITAQPHVLT